jgi:hypothetical protein
MREIWASFEGMDKELRIAGCKLRLERFFLPAGICPGKSKGKAFTILVITLVALSVASGGCLPASTALPPTDTPVPSETPTPTITVIWFPPTATATLFPTVEVTPTVNYRSDLGQIIFQDDFSSGKGWQLGRTGAGSVALGKNELSIAISEPHAYLSSMRDQPILSDFYTEITASPTLCRGADEYGLLIRAASESDFYRFSLSCDGQVRVDRVVGGAASSPQPLVFSGAVPAGAPSISQLGVWARGKEMRFFVNDMYQFSVNDPLQLSGSLGVFARSGGEMAVTVSFSDLVVREVGANP